MSIKELLTLKEQQKLSTLSDALNNNEPIVIFGAGNLGKKVAGLLISQQKNIVSFVDNNNTNWGKEVLGIKITSPKEASDKWKDKAAWIVSIWSPGHSFAQTKKQLQGLGVESIYHAAAVMQLFPNELLPHYHFQTPDYFKGKIQQIEEVHEMFADEESRKQFLAHVNARINLNFEGLPIADIDNQYFPSDIIFLTEEEVFLDAGAYDGDTLREFVERTNNKFSRYIALEPDPANYEKLKNVVRSFNQDKVEVFPYAVGAENTILKFDATGGAGASLNESGSTAVECKRIDDWFFDYKPTYMKFDIEGAELNALKGAVKTIEKYKPKLAVCIYHLPNDLWQIPLYLKKTFPFYKFYVRTHQFDGLDFVLYAI